MGLSGTKKCFRELICFKQYFWRPFSSLAWWWWWKGGGVVVGLVFCAHLWEMEWGRGEITPSQIITEGSGGFQKSLKKKSNIILVPCPIYIKNIMSPPLIEWMIEWSNDWLNDWLTDCMTVWLTTCYSRDWLTDWLLTNIQ